MKFKRINMHILSFLVLLVINHYTNADEDVTFSNTATSENVELVFHQIEGKVTPPDPKPSDWYWQTRILIDGGKKLAFLKVGIFHLEKTL